MFLSKVFLTVRRNMTENSSAIPIANVKFNYFIWKSFYFFFPSCPKWTSDSLRKQSSVEETDNVLFTFLSNFPSCLGVQCYPKLGYSDVNAPFEIRTQQCYYEALGTYIYIYIYMCVCVCVTASLTRFKYAYITTLPSTWEWLIKNEKIVREYSVDWLVVLCNGLSTVFGLITPN